MLQHVYKYFVENLTVTLYATTMLDGERWIWNGDGFSSSAEMVLDKDNLDLKPHVYSIPAEMEEFGDLWKECGIKETVDYVEVLETIKRFHDDSERSLEEIERDLQLSVQILNHLVRRKRSAQGDGLGVCACQHQGP